MMPEADTIALTIRGIIQIPDGLDSDFDHGAFDPKTRRVFVAHTGRDRVEVIDHDKCRHIATLNGFPEAAGVAAHEGHVLVTNRGAAGLAWLDAATLETRNVFATAPRPNGVAITSSAKVGIAACIGDAAHEPELQAFDLVTGQQWRIELPGRPRWCVVSADDSRVFLAIRDPSMVLVARLPDLGEVRHWPLPAGGAHGMDIDHDANRLYVACDDGALVEVDTQTGESLRQWPLDGGPDATFFNPTSGLVHVAIAKPGLVQSIDPNTGAVMKIATGAGAKTTALVVPDRLYVLSPRHGGVLDLAEA
jgi:DNA-binding beta-propeller fold protein YncE